MAIILYFASGCHIVIGRILIPHITHEGIEIALGLMVLVGYIEVCLASLIAHSQRKTMGGLPVGVVGRSGIGRAW